MAYDSAKPANDGFLADAPQELRTNFEGLKSDQIVDAGTLKGLIPGNASGNIPISNGTLNTNLNADKLDGYDGTYYAPTTHTHNTATSSSNGFMSNTDKAKLDTIATGAEVNQNAFSNVLVGSTTIQADSKTDTLEIVPGANIAVTPDATNDRITIAVAGKVPSAASADAATNATNHINAPSGAHAATAISNTPAGNISATTVQAAINELDSEVVTTATANKILKLNSNGKLPASITGDATTVGGKTPGTGADNILLLDASGKVPQENLPPIPSGVPIGSVIPWTTTTIPDGWLECNGQAISRTGFSELFAKIGTTFGSGDGSTTFNVPDLRGEFIRGWDNGRGVDSGRSLGSWQADAFKSHNHETLIGSGSGISGSSCSSSNYTPVGSFASTFTGSTETRPRNVALMFIIKAKDVAGSDPTVQGANADTLDGFHASAFALSGHTTHTGEQLSLQTNGYLKLANGLILQWGSYSAVASSSTEVTLPIAFPTRGLFIGVTHDTTGNAKVPRAKFTSTSQITLCSDTWGSPNPTTTWYWFALGY